MAEVQEVTKIYLDEPIELYGIKVGHTHKGLIHLIDHYTKVLTTTTEKTIDNPTRNHFKIMIERLNIHLQLYEKQLTTITQTNHASTIIPTKIH